MAADGRVVKIGKVRGIEPTLVILRETEELIVEASRDEVYQAAKRASAALRAGVPEQPLSGIKNEGPVRAAAYRGGKDLRGNKRLASVLLRGPKWVVVADMAARPKKSKTFVPNLNAIWGQASRWAWPIVRKYTSQFEASTRLGVRGAEVSISRRMKAIR